MKYVYSIKDTKSNCYSTPMVTLSKADAHRSFIRLASDPMSNIHMFPQDFELALIGTFDEQTGRIEIQAPAIECNGLQAQAFQKRNEEKI